MKSYKSCSEKYTSGLYTLNDFLFHFVMKPFFHFVMEYFLILCHETLLPLCHDTKWSKSLVEHNAYPLCCTRTLHVRQCSPLQKTRTKHA